MTGARSILTVGPNTLLRRGIVAFSVVMCFRTFQFAPGISYLQETWYVVCFTVVILIYPLWKIRTGLHFTRFELYIYVLIIGDVLLAAWRARQVFRQPYIYGLLSQREIVLIAVWLLLSNLLRCRWLTFADIETSLIFLAWGTFVLYTSARLLLKPSDFVDYGEGFVTRPMIGVEPSFKFQPYFLVFGGLYYAILGFRSGKARCYVLAFLLLLVAPGSSGRGLVICVLITLVLFLYTVRGLLKATIFSARCASLAAILGVLVYAIAPDRVLSQMNSYSEAISVALTGSAIGDPSANARIYETLAAVPYIQAHPLLGNGVISHQWQGGSEMAMGGYFFASDIGLLGTVFSFGICGMLLYGLQYRIAWFAVGKMPDYAHSPFLDATKAFVLFSALYSLETGLYVWDAGITLFFITILDGFAVHIVSLAQTRKRVPVRCQSQRPALSA